MAATQVLPRPKAYDDTFFKPISIWLTTTDHKLIGIMYMVTGILSFVIGGIFALIIVLAIAVYSFVELQKDFQPITDQQMTVVVSGHPFGWIYRYDNQVVVDQEGTLAGDVTPFVVPVNTLVKLQFEGTDVIHSWWVPAISGKTDAVPGYDNFSWLKIDRVGTWRGECAELCGAGHSTMQIIVQAMDRTDYDQWVQTQLAKTHASPTPSASPSPS